MAPNGTSAEKPKSMVLSPLWTFAGLVAFILASRLILISWTGAIDVDSVRYLAMGRLWAGGEFGRALAQAYHPAYPALLGLITAPFTDPILPARLLSVTITLLTLIPIGYMGRVLGDRAGMWAALILYALAPHPWRYSVQVISEPLYLLFILSSSAFALHTLKRGSPKAAVFAGGAAALAYLTRPEGGMALMALFVALGLPRADGFTWKRRLLAGLAALAAFSVLAAPYMIHLGGITPKKRTARLAGIGNYTPHEPAPVIGEREPRRGPSRTDPPPGATSPEPEQNPSAPTGPSPRPDLTAWEIVGVDPDVQARQAPVASPLLTALALFGKAGLFITPFIALAGFALRRLDRAPANEDAYLAALAVINVVLVLGLLLGYRYASLRHTMTATVATLPMAAFAAVALWRRCGPVSPRAGRTFLALWGIAFGLFFLCQGFRPLRYPKRYLEQTGLQLKQRASPSDLIISDDPRFAWYAGTGYVGLGRMPFAELTATARARNVRFLVTTRATLRDRVPDFPAPDATDPWTPVDLEDAGEGTGHAPIAFELSGR